MPVIYINNDDIRLNSSSSDKVVVTGSLGVGTTAPLTRLTLSSAGDNFIYQTFDRSTGGANARYWQQGIDVTHGFNWGRATDAGVFTSYMKIDSTGNVGIGTTSPGAKLNVNTDAMGVTVSDASGISLTNSTAAAAGAQQMSPTLKWSGQGWKTNATAASQNVSFISFLTPVQGSANPSGLLNFASSINGGAYATQMTLTSAGALSISAGLTATTGTFSSTLTNTIANLTTTPTDGTVIVTPTAATAVIPVRISPRLRISATAWNTGGTPASNTMNWTIDNIPVSGNPPTAALRFNFDRNGGGYSTLVNFTSEGNVGVGTTAPASVLHLVKNDSTQDPLSITNKASIIIQNTYGSLANTGPALFFESDSGTYNTFAGIAGNMLGSNATGSWGHLTFGTKANDAATSLTERMRITNGGNVGINTTSPGAKLEVAGGSANWNETTQGTSVGTIHLNPGVSTDDFGNAITFGASDSGGGATAQAGIYLRTDGNYGTKMYFSTTDSYAVGSKTRMFIGHNGNVGIGTTSPAQKLEVNGSVLATSLIKSGGTSSQYLMADGSVSTTSNVAPRYVQTINVSQTAYTTICTITGGSLASAVNMSFQGTSGNVVVNVTAQILVNHFQDITITTTSGFYSQLNIRVISNNNETYSVEAQVVSAQGQTTDLNIEVFPLNSESVTFGGSPVTPGTTLVHTTRQGLYVSASEPMSISSGSDIYAAGNVGIGTTSPTYKLQSEGSIVSAGEGNARLIGFDFYDSLKYNFYVDGSADADKMIVRKGTTNVAAFDTNGNFGIGTTNPAQKLSVQGEIAKYTTSGIDGTFDNLIKYGYSADLQSGTAVANRWIGIDATVTAGGAVSNVLRIRAYPGTTGNAVPVNVADFRGDQSAVFYGNVGIGVTAPASKLHVWNGGVQVTGFPSSGSPFTFLQSDYNDAGVRVKFLNVNPSNGYDSDLGIQLSNTSNVITDVMRIKGSTGNVGIGTTDPSTKLHVAGTGRFEGNVGIGYGSNSEYSIEIGAGRTGNGFAYIDLIGDATYTDYGLRILRNNSGANTPSSITHRGLGDLTITTEEAAPMVFGTSSAERMRITSAGNVGINTTNPTERLDVDGSGKLRGNLFLTATDPYIEGSGSGAMRIKHTAGQSMYIRPDQSGDVVFFEGVSGQAVYLNTASPSVNSTQNSSSTLTFEARARNAGGTLNIRSTSLQNTVYDIPNNLSRFSITGQNVLHLDGNVGIGTTSPSSKLNIVDGFIRVQGTEVDQFFLEGLRTGTSTTVRIYDNSSVAFYDSYSSTIFRANQLGGSGGYIGLFGGNVGINTTNPSYKLHVVGGAAVQDGDLRLTQGYGITWNNGDNYIRGISGYHLQFTTYDGVSAQTEVMRITGGSTASGGARVGIGTTSPNAKLNVNTNALGVTVNDASGISLTNSTAAAAGAQQMSPALKWTGQGWKTTAPAASQSVSFISYVLPAQGTSSPSGELFFASSINSGSYNSIMRLSSVGSLILSGGLTALTGYFNGTITNVISSLTTTPTDGTLIVNSAVASSTTPVRISPRLRLSGAAWNTGGTPASNTMNWTIDNIPVSGNPPTAALRFNFDRNNGGYSTLVNFSSNGNVGIGTTTQDTPLGTARGIVINSGAGNDAQVRLQNNGTGTAASDGGLLSISGSQMYLWNYEASNLIFGTNNSERMRIDSSGNIGIGTTSISYRVDISGDARILSGSLGVGVAPNATDGRIDASNDIVAYSTSDQRLKENVTPIENALEKVKTLTGVEFDWKEETAHVHGYRGHDVGIIAQDVQAVLPEAVRTNDSGYLSVRYEKMIALLIQGMKEQQNQIDELKAKLDGLTR